MSMVFRGKLLEGLAQLYQGHKLTVADNWADLAGPAKLADLRCRSVSLR